MRAAATNHGGKSYKAGEGVLTISGATQTEIPVTFPPMVDVPGVSFRTIGGEFFMTFVYSKPLPIEQDDPDQHWARFHWKIKDSFRWTDLSLPGYATDVWDTSVNPLQSEVVSMYGVSGYYVTTSID